MKFILRITLAIIIIISWGCPQNCGFEQEPYFYLSFYDDQGFRVQSIYDYITAENINHPLDSVYNGPTDVNITLPIDMNRDYVQFFMVRGDVTDTLRLNYTRAFIDNGRRCGINCLISNVGVESNLPNVEVNDDNYGYYDDIDGTEPVTVIITI